MFIQPLDDKKFHQADTDVYTDLHLNYRFFQKKKIIKKINAWTKRNNKLVTHPQLSTPSHICENDIHTLLLHENSAQSSQFSISSELSGQSK